MIKNEEKKKILEHMKETYRIYNDIYILNLYLDRHSIKYLIELIEKDIKIIQSKVKT